jgi:hypothetical protein
MLHHQHELPGCHWASRRAGCELLLQVVLRLPAVAGAVARLCQERREHVRVDGHHVGEAHRAADHSLHDSHVRGAVLALLLLLLTSSCAARSTLLLLLLLQLLVGQEGVGWQVHNLDSHTLAAPGAAVHSAKRAGANHFKQLQVLRGRPAATVLSSCCKATTTTCCCCCCRHAGYTRCT